MHLTQLRLGFALLVSLALSMLLVTPAVAQSINIELASDTSLATRTVQLLVLITLLSIVPGLAMMVTCFPFIVTVLAILRQAIGLQQSPPNMLLVTLALFLTYFVMEPVLIEVWQIGIEPLLAEEIELEQALRLGAEPITTFMAMRVDPDVLQDLSTLRPDATISQAEGQIPLSVLTPAFMLSEIERAFQVGFVIFLPFLIIDLVVAAILMSMGMMMVPPAIVALPFKLAFFVVADGWSLIATSLVRGYGLG